MWLRISDAKSAKTSMRLPTPTPTASAIQPARTANARPSGPPLEPGPPHQHRREHAEDQQVQRQAPAQQFTRLLVVRGQDVAQHGRIEVDGVAIDVVRRRRRDQQQHRQQRLDRVPGRNAARRRRRRRRRSRRTSPRPGPRSRPGPSPARPAPPARTRRCPPRSRKSALSSTRVSTWTAGRERPERDNVRTCHGMNLSAGLGRSAARTTREELNNCQPRSVPWRTLKPT